MSDINKEIQSLGAEITEIGKKFDQTVSKADFNRLNERLETLGKMQDSQKDERKHPVFKTVSKANAFCDWLAVGPLTGLVNKTNPVYPQDINRANELNVTTDAEGGYLVPDLFSQDLIDLREFYGEAWKYHNSYEILGKSLEFAKNNGGTSAVFETTESEAKTPKAMTFGYATLTPKTLYNLIVSSDRLIAQSRFVVAQLVGEELVRGFNQRIDYVTFQGNGVADANNGGITGYANSSIGNVNLANYAALFTNTPSGKPNDAVVTGVDALVKCMNKVHTRGFDSDTAWYMNRRTRDGLQSVKDSNGNLVYRIGDVSSAPFGTILGYPVRPIEMFEPNTLLNQDPGQPSEIEGGDMVVLFGSLRKAGRIGYTRKMSISYSPHAYWVNNRSGWKCVGDYDFQIVDTGAAAKITS